MTFKVQPKSQIYWLILPFCTAKNEWIAPFLHKTSRFQSNSSKNKITFVINVELKILKFLSPSHIQRLSFQVVQTFQPAACHAGPPHPPSSTHTRSAHLPACSHCSQLMFCEAESLWEIRETAELCRSLLDEPKYNLLSARLR